MSEAEDYPAGLLTPRRAIDTPEIWLNRVDGREVIKELMLLIAGVEIEYTPNGNAVIKETAFQSMSLEGANKLHVLLRDVINPVTTLTNFSENQVNHHTAVVTNELSVWLVLNYHKYNMKKEYIQPLLSTLAVTINAQLNRAFQGKEAEWVSMEHSRREEKGSIKQEIKEGRR